MSTVKHIAHTFILDQLREKNATNYETCHHRSPHDLQRIKALAIRTNNYDCKPLSVVMTTTTLCWWNIPMYSKRPEPVRNTTYVSLRRRTFYEQPSYTAVAHKRMIERRRCAEISCRLCRDVMIRVVPKPSVTTTSSSRLTLLSVSFSEARLLPPTSSYEELLRTLTRLFTGRMPYYHKINSEPKPWRTKQRFALNWL